MKFPMQKLLYPFLLPNGLLFVVTAVFLSRDTLPESIIPFLEIFPPVVLGIAMLLGWRFNRTRLIYAILILFLSDRILDYFSTAGSSSQFVFVIVTTALPLNLLIVSLFKERGLFNARGAIWLAFLTAQVIGASWLYAHLLKQSIFWLRYQALPFPLDLQPTLTQPTLLMFFLSLSILTIRFYLRPAALEASFLWALATILFGLLYPDGQALTLYFAAAGLMLVIGVVETSHFMAYRDELTGLPERRALNEALAKLGSKYTFAMLDIDHFKKFNDTHGHDVGDQVLKMVAAKLSNVTGGGKTYRFGGEEFSIIFPRAGVEDALPHLDQVREAVANARFIPRGKDRPKKKPKRITSGSKTTKPLSVTISIGAAEKKPEFPNSDQIIKAADQALYRAKKAGRNRVCV
ncbi:MAG TPA: GGDEF domain-containing protein [Geopsychrobacteraceae bacterium]|nr:GGDEF domain-containing protein [Geopsychrobacteraceae bacterium]